MQKSGEFGTAEHVPLEGEARILDGNLTHEAQELTEVGVALGVHPSITLDAIRNYGAEVVRQAMAVTARDVTGQAGVH